MMPFSRDECVAAFQLRYQELDEYGMLTIASINCEKGCDAEDGVIAEPYFTG